MKYNSISIGNGIEQRLNVTLEWMHFLSHRGRIFGFSFEDLDLGTAETDYILMRTGDEPVHTFFQASATGFLKIELFEDAVVSNNGTTLPILPYSRLPNSYQFGMTAFTGPTVTSEGTLIGKRRILGHTQGASSAAVAISDAVELVLKPNTNYLVKNTTTTASTALTLVGVFYDEEV